MQMCKKKYKSGWYDLEIVRDFWCKIILYILGARFLELLEKHNKYVPTTLHPSMLAHTNSEKKARPVAPQRLLSF
jgi:hypothetical protein